MARSTSNGELATHQRRYRQLAAQLADIGFIASGSIVRRYTRCGSAGCRCHADPPQRHGPYYQWSAKIDGKTVTRRLNEREAALYQEWIDNDRQLRALISQMRDIAGRATRLILEDTNTQASEV